MKNILAWYFSAATKKLRNGDGREIALGIEHTVKGYPVLCEHGLHASERLLDALKYAPGAIIWRVELSGRIKNGDDKIAATRRRYIAGGIDISDILRLFARKQALSVAHLWDMPAIVRQYLETGDDSIRSAAWSSARYAARSAAWSAVGYAAWSSARYAARYAAWYAAWSAVGYDTGSAAWSAAWSAVGYDTGSAAWSGANDMLTKMVESAIMNAEKE